MDVGRADGARPAGDRLRGVRSALAAALRIPLFVKILVANAVIVAVASWIGTVPGLLVSLAVNAAILHVALGPLRTLEATVERVRAGDLSARSPHSIVADARLERLITTFNETVASLADVQAQFRAAAARALDAQEGERLRLARELHDDTAQALATLRLQLETARRSDDPRRRDALLEQVREGLGAAGESVRRFARGLRPPALDELGLVAALQTCAETQVPPGGPAVSVTARAVGRLEPAIELAIYRMAQEAIANAVRHGRANRIGVDLERRDGALTLEISDDGVGFDPGRVAPQRLGIFGMKERAALAGGTLDIRSTPGAGTVVRIAVPLRPGS